MNLRIPFRIPRLEAVTLVLVVAISISMPVLQFLGREVGRYAPPGLSRANHQNMADTMVNAPLLLSFAAELGAPLHRGDYENATRLVVELLKRQPNLEYMFKTYLTLLRETVDGLNVTRENLKQAKILLGNGKLDEARVKIAQARTAIDETYGKLHAVSLSIDRIQATYHVDVGSQTALLRILTSTLAEYENQVRILEDATKEMDMREPTHLTVQLSNSTAWVESTVKFTGLLTDKVGPLRKRTVQVMIRDKLSQEVVTDREGKFVVDLFVSQTFGKELAVNARYLPRDDDEKAYRPSLSSTLILHVLYHSPELSIELSPARVHVEEQVHVSGVLTGLDGIPLQNRRVALVVGGKVLNETTTRGNGRYEMNFVFRRPTSSGTYLLRTVFTPETDRYSEATSEEREIELYYLPTRVMVTACRSWLFSGGPASVEGLLEYDQKSQVEKQVVLILLGGGEVSRTETDEKGVYAVTFLVPMMMSGTQNLTVALMTSAPWYESSEATVRVTVYNSVTVAFSIVAIVVCILVALRTPVSRREPRVRVKTMPPRLLPQPPPTLDSTWIRSRENSRDQVRAAYARVKALIEYLFGYESKPSQTHLEFLEEVKVLIGSMDMHLRGLTQLYEIAEYSEHPFTIEDSEQAISEAETIFHELGRKI